MKIALLNLQYDNNYGGNLQRFALIKVLQKLGHEVTHLNLRFRFFPDSKLVYLKILFWRIFNRIVKKQSIEIFQEKHRKQEYIKSCEKTDIFYNRYIPHTEIIEHKKSLSKYAQEFETFIVGSDQVWRKKITQIHGIEPFFFDFLPPKKTRIAYGVSFGSEENELSNEEIQLLTPLFKQFKAVSVREVSALQLLSLYQWDNPKAKIVLDPTLLLNQADYNEIISENNTIPSEGDLFCYILDKSDVKDDFIKAYAQQHVLKPFFCPSSNDSIPQWLRSFKDAKYVITDSYHGVLFSIIYNKPFHLFQNAFRGQSRFSSLEKILDTPLYSGTFNWQVINNQLHLLQKQSINFLTEALTSEA